jgi:hypothetical protein
MGFLSQYSGTEDVDLSDLQDAPEGTWIVTIKSCLTNGEMDRCKGHLSRLVDSKAAPDMVNYQREMVVASVVSWNLTDDADAVLPYHPAPVLRDSIRALPEQVFSRIYAAVNERNSDRDKDERRRFRGRDGSRTEDGVGGGTGDPGLLVEDSPLVETGAEA